MYTLRIIDKDNGVINIALGDEYSKVTKDFSPEKWENINEFMKKNDSPLSNCYIISQNGVIYNPKGMESYIMTESGSTFEKV